jgi:hypothetical protein
MSNRCKPDTKYSHSGIPFPVAAGTAFIQPPPMTLQK